ncbi:MAG: M42 family peptidase [Clostridiales bacterium]|nr:M42 family peptidase [Clostridiales bacterium]
MNTFEILDTLTQACGPSGYELSWASQTAAALLEPLVDTVRIDPMGNVIGVRRCGKKHAKRLLLDAHIDEVGMLVTGYEEGGFLRFTQLGGIDPRLLPDREVTILAEQPLFGVVTAQSAHLYEGADSASPMTKLAIDTGYATEKLKELVPVGTPVVYRESCFALGKKQIASKSMDDRSCFAVILKALQLLARETLDMDLYVVGSCCEEVGGQGAVVTAYDIAPDWAVVLDVTFATTPDAPDKGFALGSGPAIGIGPNVAWWMAERFICKAKELNIPYSEEVMAGNAGTNGWELQISREGVPTAILSLPEKYMHTPIEVIHRKDFKQCARLLAAFVRDLGKEAEQCC